LQRRLLLNTLPGVSSPFIEKTGQTALIFELKTVLFTRNHLFPAGPAGGL